MVVVKMMILDYPICRVVFHVEKLKRVPSCIVGESAITFSIPRVPPPFFSFLLFFLFPFFHPAIEITDGQSRLAQTMLESAVRSVAQSVGRPVIFVL